MTVKPFHLIIMLPLALTMWSICSTTHAVSARKKTHSANLRKKWAEHCIRAENHEKKTYDLLMEHYKVSDLWLSRRCEKLYDKISIETKIHLPNKEISDLSPLSLLNGLEELNLTGNKIKSLSPLSNLTNLRKLYLSNNDISDPTPLSQLHKLEELTLSNNEISSVYPLRKLTNLKKLHLGNKKIHNYFFRSLKSLFYGRPDLIHGIGSLSGLKNLEELVLSYNEISDIEPLAELSNLRILDLSSNAIRHLDHLSELTKLEFLDATSNFRLQNIEGISGLTELKVVKLAYEHDHYDLSPIAQLNKINKLTIECNNHARFESSSDIDFSFLSELTDLQELVLKMINISNLNPLAELYQLQILDLERCANISDLSPLSGLHQLKILNLDGNDRITDLGPIEGIEGLKVVLDYKLISDEGQFSKYERLRKYEKLDYVDKKEYVLDMDLVIASRFNDSLDPSVSSEIFEKLAQRQWEPDLFYQEILASNLLYNQETLDYAAKLAVQFQTPEIFQLLIDLGAQLGVNSFSWGQLHKLASSEKHKKIIEDTYKQVLWNRHSPEERRNQAIRKIRNLAYCRKADQEMDKIRQNFNGGHIEFLNFEQHIFGHEADIFLGDKSIERKDSAIIRNRLNKILSGENMTTSFLKGNTDHFHFDRHCRNRDFEYYLDQHQDDLEILILSGHGNKIDGTWQFISGNSNELIDLSLLKEKTLRNLKLIVLSCCYPNQVASQMSKYLPSSVAILHTDSLDKTKCHDFENLVEYLMGKRVKNTQLSPSNCAIKCIFGQNCTCTLAEGSLPQLENAGQLYSGSSKYMPVKITWGKLEVKNDSSSEDLGSEEPNDYNSTIENNSSEMSESNATELNVGQRMKLFFGLST